MLKVDRQPGQPDELGTSITIEHGGEVATVTILECSQSGSRIGVGIDAPTSFRILRDNAKQKEPSA